MNKSTADKIKYIATLAHEDCALTTLKNAKAQIENRCKVLAGYEYQWAEVDRAAVLAAFAEMMQSTRKADFMARAELLAETMERRIEDAIFDTRVAHCIKIANRDYGVWVTAAEVIEAAAGNHLFNFTSVAKMLAEEKREAAANDARTDDEGHDVREWCGNDIEAAHAEALALNEMPKFTNETVPVFKLETGMRIAAVYQFHTIEAIQPSPEHENKYRLQLRRNDGTTWALDVSCMTELQISSYRVPQPAAPTPELIEAHLMQVEFYAANDYSARRAIIEAAHAEALAMAAELFPAPAKRGRPAKKLEAIYINQTDGEGINRQPARVFVCHLTNGKRYEFTEGINRLCLLAGGEHREYKKVIRNDRILAAIREAIAKVYPKK